MRFVKALRSAVKSKQADTNGAEGFSVYLVDAEHYIEKTELSPEGFTLGANQIALIMNY